MNLQEQGRLLRQEEFLVFQGRKKSMRQIFLFEDLILFSKTRRGRQGQHDIYIYKTSFKVKYMHWFVFIMAIEISWNAYYLLPYKSSRITLSIATCGTSIKTKGCDKITWLQLEKNKMPDFVGWAVIR